MKKILIFIIILFIYCNGYAGLTEKYIDRDVFGIKFGMSIEEIRENQTVIDLPRRTADLVYYGVLSEDLLFKNVLLIKCGLINNEVVFINVVYNPEYSSSIGWGEFKRQYIDKYGSNSPEEILEYTENYYNSDISIIHKEISVKEVLGWSNGLTTLYIVNAHDEVENIDFFMCTYLDLLKLSER